MAASEPSTSAPVASQHVFLNELPKLKAHTKVRFICCVLDYEPKTGRLLVEHAYPADSTYVPKAYVDANVVMEMTRDELFANGAWLNVIGYVQEKQSTSKTRRSSSTKLSSAALPIVQAVLMWDAGSIRVNEYEAAMVKQREALKKAKDSLQKYQ